ncbi:MAG: tetratricopeptide repeat protein [Pseudomonadota bacterium]
MSDSDSFISEVSEEVRKEKLYAFLRRWGWLIGLVVLTIVGGTAANEWRKHAREQAAQSNGDAIQAAFLEPDPSARASALGEIASSGSAAALAARFAQAGSLDEAGSSNEAGAILASIAEDPEVEGLYQSLARLQRVMILGDALELSERLATLDLLTTPDSPFRNLALEQRAVIRLELGETDRALDDLESILRSPQVTEAQRLRARELIRASGGNNGSGDFGEPSSGATPIDG